MNETATRSTGERGGPTLLVRHVLGLGVLLLTVVPAYLAAQSEVHPSAETASETASQTPSDADEPASPTPPRSIAVEIEAHIREVAVRHGISPLLVAAIIEAESEFNPRAVSRRGARGLMQLMPRTAMSLEVENTFDPYENIDGGVRHLRRLIDRFNGDVPLALAAYNAGEQAVASYGGIPPYPETRRYVARILRRIGRRDLAADVSRRRTQAVVTAAWRSRQALERQASGPAGGDPGAAEAPAPVAPPRGRRGGSHGP